MRYVNMLFCVLMILFALVQYNDPDGLLWIAIYMIPAVFAGLAAFQPRQLQSGVGRVALATALVAGIGCVVYYWPTTPEFWRKDVWWQTETAREGMGVTIGFAVLLIAFLTTRSISASAK